MKLFLERVVQTIQNVKTFLYWVYNFFTLWESSSYFIIGDGISFSKGQKEIERLAEILGAKVYGADVVLIAGTYIFPEVFPSIGNPFREDAKIIHIDLDTYEIGKNFGVTIGIGADPTSTIRSFGHEEVFLE